MAGTHPTYLWLNGERTRWEDGTIHVSELGWSTIGAVFEGIRAYWNADEGELYVFRLQEHLERLARSMKLVRLPLRYSLDELAAATRELLRANESREDTYIFPLAYTANSYTSRYDRPDAQSALQILTRPMPSHLGSDLKMRARVSSWRRISEEVMPPRVKNISNYRNGQLARMESLLDGYDTSLIINGQGKVSEAPGACVMFVRDGKLITPDLTSGILESITRDALITLAREELGLAVEERSVDRTELYVADEVFLCGTAAEISPVVSVDKYDIGDGEIGPITRELAELFEGVLRGRESRYGHWRAPVGVREAVAV
ncbi:MAG: branched-chain amino acid aminotransferase [Thermomicrobiales bacterium]|nr:branched-chain amino acid aminotransferase [Thermomicrobiales bacterium]